MYHTNAHKTWRWLCFLKNASMGRVKKWLSDQPWYPVIKISTSFFLSFYFFIFALFNCLVLLFGGYCKAYVALFLPVCEARCGTNVLYKNRNRWEQNCKIHLPWAIAHDSFCMLIGNMFCFLGCYSHQWWCNNTKVAGSWTSCSEGSLWARWSSGSRGWRWYNVCCYTCCRTPERC